MATKARKKVRRSFVVTLDMPPDVSVEIMRLYVKEAVGLMYRSERPDEPIFDLDASSVRVKAVPDANKKSN